MKVDFYTYNQPNIKYQTPNFAAKPIKVNWNSDAGQRIEKALVWLASISAASVAYYTASEDKSKFDEETIEEMKNFSEADADEEVVVSKLKSNLETSYRGTNDNNIVDKHANLIRDAYYNRDLLKGGFSELSDYELARALVGEDIVTALGLLGKGTLEAAFNLDISGFENLCNDILDFTETISRNNLELLREKINPETSLKYRNLDEEVKKDKRKINQLLGKENFAKRNELQEQINILKTDKSNNKEIKELKKQIQNLYKNCENSEQIKDLMQKINEKQLKMKEILKGKVNLPPQEIINKVWTIAAISQSPYYTKEVLVPKDIINQNLEMIENLGEKTDRGTYLFNKIDYARFIDTQDFKSLAIVDKRKLNKDMKELIELIQEPSEENDKAWKKNIDKKLYEKAGLQYIENYANLLNLSDCKYLNELIMSDNNFWTIFPEFLYILGISITEDNLNIDDGLDNFVNNYETKSLFEERNIDYYKWSRFDENSYISDKVTITAEDAREKAVKNMGADLYTLYTSESIPQEERDQIFDALEQIGFHVIKEGENIGFSMDGEGTLYDLLPDIMTIIKYILNTNLFWVTENENKETDKIRDTLYNHFINQRKQEIDCVRHLKESETVDIKVQKVNMSDIKYSLCLGNHSHCCTGLGSQINEWSAITYIMNRCISAIEVLANGEPVGNTMMYLADVNRELSLVLDDIELQTKFQNNEKIKDMIIKYAKQVCSEIGKPDIPIYAGPGMHKIDMSDFPLQIDNTMTIIGKTSEDAAGIYLDFDCDEHFVDGRTEICNLYRIA